MLQPGTTLDHDRYRVEAVIGRGGFGYVYRARERLTGETVAIKELVPSFVDDQQMVQRFIQEARLTLRLSHPRIVRTYGIFEDRGAYYLAMEYLPGGSLANRLKHGPLPIDEALRIATELCEALEEAHEQDVVHCDIKPANVLFDEQGRVHLTDFGIAHVSTELMTRQFSTAPGTAMGTVRYMAPEQLEGVRDDPRVDVYAVGTLLYEMLAGRPYLDFETESTPGAQYRNIGRIKSAPPRPLRSVNPAVPEHVAGVVERALRKPPGERFVSAKELRGALQPPDEPEPFPPKQALSLALGRLSHRLKSVPNWGRAAGGMALAALLIGGGVWLRRILDPGPVTVSTATPTPSKTSRAAPTSTVVPTVTPTPSARPSGTPTVDPTVTPMATIDADPSLYEDFDDPSNDGSFDRARWVVWADSPNRIVQEDGVLMLSAEIESEASGGANLRASKYDRVNLSTLTSDTPFFVEAELMLSQKEHAGNVQLHLSADFEDGSDWFSECHITENSEGGALAQCFDTRWPWQEGYEYSSKAEAIDLETWHSFRIELDPASMNIAYFIDNQAVGSHVPADAERLTQAEFSVLIGVWRPSPGNIRGYIDDVRIGQIAADSTRFADNMVMIHVPAGQFEMGSTEGSSSEAPIHTVALDEFWIDRTEVTNAQYALCVEEGGCDESRYADNPEFSGDDHPVVGVDWYDAEVYCAWAGARLPTEAEWEYAARGPQGRIYPWGGDAPTCDLAQYSECPDRTVPVGSFPDGASWCGALDMAGNVWEWVADWYGDYPSGRQANPAGPSSGDYKLLRGGSWYYDRDFLRGAHRYWIYPVLTWHNAGFRCARDSE